jgi:hypothetical protein
MIMRCLVVLIGSICLASASCVVGAEAHCSLSILPGDFTLTGPSARQSLVVERLEDGKFVGECSDKLQFTSTNPQVVKIEDGIAIPAGNGEATIRATAGEQSASIKVTVRDADKQVVPSFRNQVQPILAAAGCSSGACHGAAAGKSGFKLSLRGYDDEGDYRIITRHALGRRVLPADPAHSLLLLKPTAAVPHKGGERIKVGSPEYSLLAEWIASGTPGPRDGDARIASIEFVPRQIIVRPGAQQRLLVLAHFSDGTTHDVTRWAKYTAGDTTVATVEEGGKVRVMGMGEGPITAWFLSRIATATITVPFEQVVSAVHESSAHRSSANALTAHDVSVHESAAQDSAGHESTALQPSAHDSASLETSGRNFIDKLVLEKLRSLNLPPSRHSTDSEFIRRAFLDTIGILPTADEAKKFLADEAPDKRDRLIESLLARPEFVDYWTYKWSDLLLVSSKKLKAPGMWAYYNWIREQVAANTHWDDLARKIVTASGSTLENGAANFYLLHDDPTRMSETVSQAFLGMSINCAKCHNHPMEKWTNNQYFAMANLFARVRTKNATGDGNFIVFAAPEGDLVQPLTGRPQPPTPLDGTPIAMEASADRRTHLVNWLVSRDNPYFSRAITNRVWANFMGVGLVESVDDMRKTNPATNEALLAALSNHLADEKFDLKALMRTILQSDTYQRSSQPLAGNAADRHFYSHYYPRRMMAEVLLDSLSEVTGAPTAFKDFPSGTRAIQLPDSNVDSYFLKAFGRPDRNITCECERTAMPSMAQVLHIANGDTINQKLQAKGNRLEKLLASSASDEMLVQEAYLSALARYPSDEEKSQMTAALRAAKPSEKREVLEDIYWGILSSNRFLFNQ